MCVCVGSHAYMRGVLVRMCVRVCWSVCVQHEDDTINYSLLTISIALLDFTL